MDENCVIQRANFAASEMFGHNIFEIIGKPCYEIDSRNHPTARRLPSPSDAIERPSGARRTLFTFASKKLSISLFLRAAIESGGFRGCVGIFVTPPASHSAENELRNANSEVDRLGELSLSSD